jgi:hypothetical protein
MDNPLGAWVRSSHFWKSQSMLLMPIHAKFGFRAERRRCKPPSLCVARHVTFATVSSPGFPSSKEQRVKLKPGK